MSHIQFIVYVTYTVYCLCHIYSLLFMSHIQLFYFHNCVLKFLSSSIKCGEFLDQLQIQLASQEGLCSIE
jgi:hypothetical protein